ncbi:hypothetical protein JHE06_05490 [Carnobacterium sp. CS13]|uniref:DUF6731 family protein n=1 Tax=Carnobacterium sp. CS13 TaxID=2800128 RepID=UPI0019123604|nr:DUF6731 family protein [Carnobacterium sp. CS13]QQP71224.1 hypothetical protein JHE06_05490 [Carnobacterium sp. CS13]
MAKNKRVKFYYFHILAYKNKEVKFLELLPLLNDIKSKYDGSEDRFVYEYKGEKAKLAYVSLPYDNDSYCQLTFERLRDYNFPVKTKLVGDSEELDLSSDEFLGEEVTVLYDSVNSVMMIQNNRDSLGYKAIELFLNSLLQEQEQGITMTLMLITEKDPYKRAKRLIGMKDVLFKGNIQLVETGNGPVGDLIDAIKGEVTSADADILDVEVRIISKNKKTSTREFIPDTITNEILSYSKKDGVTKLYVKGRNVDGLIDEVNLIENKLFDSYNFNFKENKKLNKHSIYSEMEKLYKEKGKVKIQRNG